MDFIDNDQFWQWVSEHIADDPVKLRLAWHGREPWINDAVRQIECRRKYRRKLAAEVAMPRFYFPTSLSGEQSTGDALASLHAGMIPEDAESLIDLTSGLGIDVMAVARMRNLGHITAVEHDSILAQALRHNSTVMGCDVDVVCADCRDYVKTLSDNAFDVAFIDPARRDAKGGRVYGLSDCEPDVVAMLSDIRSKMDTLIVKMSPMLDVTQTLRDLPGVTDLWALGTSTECKELVVKCDLRSGAEVGEPLIHAVTPEGEFMFTRSEEAEAEVDYGEPEAGGWLYEPWPAVMKVAPWRLLSSRYGALRLHQNTNLYYSPDPIPDFPGDGRRVIEVLPFASSVLKQLPRRYQTMEVAVRNFPMTADVLAKKLHARQGAHAIRLIATTVTPHNSILIVLEEMSV